MRPFTPHLRLRRDARRPERLLVQSDVPQRAHAIALSLGVALVAGGHGLGQILASRLGVAAEAGIPLAVAAAAALGWLALPSMVRTTSFGRELIEVRRSRRRRPELRLLPEEVTAVRLAAPAGSGAGAPPWRLADRQVELVTNDGSVTVAIAAPPEARALARGLSVAVRVPLRDDTPEAEASFCLQQAMLAMGRLDAAPPPPEGCRLRAGLERGWLVLEMPARAPGRLAQVLLVGTGASLLVAPAVLEAWPAVADSAAVGAALTAVALTWLVAVVRTVIRTHRPAALAVSPLGVKLTRPGWWGRATTNHLSPPVTASHGPERLELRGDARLVLPTGAQGADLEWACTAVDLLAGEPLVADVPTPATRERAG